MGGADGGPREARALLDSTFVETHGRFAPRGRWFVYTSKKRAGWRCTSIGFPNAERNSLVSTSGGGWPRWASDGSEIVYLSPDNKLMAVAVHASRDRLDIAAPRRLFALRPRPPVRLDAYPYDVSPDGQRFVVNTLMEDTTSTAITVVLNWPDGLTKQ